MVESYAGIPQVSTIRLNGPDDHSVAVGAESPISQSADQLLQTRFPIPDASQKKF
jgi:hypothetical protein